MAKMHGLTTAEEQILELRSATPIHTNNFAVDHSFAFDVEIGCNCFSEINE
jgi:hypothetical protein